MTVLAIDTAHAAVSVCVMDLQGNIRARESQPMSRGHSEALLPAVERVLEAASVDFPDLTRVAVVTGPGSFTGIRIGISAARAIGLACGIPVVGISSLPAFAAPLIGAEAGVVIAAAIDAKHGQVYVQGFSSKGHSLLPPRIAKVRDAVRALGAGQVRLVGSGAPMMAIEAWSMGMEADVIGDAASPDIAFVARLGLLGDPEQAPARPFYLKAPDAKPYLGGSIARTV
jgi:tRNA threonylcarbamoyl adenosine modification protein YeaZ